MAFTVNDYYDLVRLLREHPEWKEELRNLLLGEEILSLPRMMKELISRIDELAEAQRKTEESIRELARAHRKLETTVGAMRGRLLELTYRERADIEKGRFDRDTGGCGRGDSARG